MNLNNPFSDSLSHKVSIKQLIKILILSVVFCFLTLIAFLPNNIPFIGLMALALFIHIGKTLSAIKWPIRIGIIFFVSILFQWFLFQDIILALIHIAHIPRAGAWGLFLLHGFLWQIKIPLMLFFPFLFEKRVPLFFSLPLFALITDFFSWEIIPWSWSMYVINDSSLRQYASIGGMHLVSLFVFVFAFFIYEMRLSNIKIIINQFTKKFALKNIGKSFFLYLAAWIVLIFIYLYGYQLSKPEKGYATIKVAYIQTDSGRAYRSLASDLEFAQKSLSQVFSLSVALLQKRENYDLIVLPESAIPFHGVSNSAENKAKGIYSTTFHSLLRFLSFFSQAPVVFNEMGYEENKLFNYISVMESDGTVTARYQKRRLFPFGEYIPLEKTFPRLRSLFAEASRYTSGQENKLLSFYYIPKKEIHPILPELSRDFLTRIQNPDFIYSYPMPIIKKQEAQKFNFIPLLCYEGLWQSLTGKSITNARKKNTRYDLLVNIANDTWFGPGIIADLHLSSVRWRAIESGRSLVRVGLENNSVLISPKGDFLSPISQKGSEIGSFFVPLYKQETVFTRYGEIVIFFLLSLFIAVIVLYYFQIRREKITTLIKK